MLKTIALLLCAITLLTSPTTWAGERQRNQAKRIHDRLTGVTATNAVLDVMEGMIAADSSGKSAAEYAISTTPNPAVTPSLNPNAHYFYNVTLKNFAAPWTNEEQTVFTPLNDYSATVIGAIRDAVDFREILYGDLVYIGDVGDISSYD